MKRFELLAGEEILIAEPIHWKNKIIPVTVFAASMLLFFLRTSHPLYPILSRLIPTVHPDKDTQLMLTLAESIALLTVMAMCFIRIMQVHYTRYYVTSLRIIAISGILRTSFQEMLLSRCETVYLHQGVYERMYGSGDILCVSAGSHLLLDDVRQALTFKQTILARITENKNIR